ncbi:hypothetical protein [Sulfurospirillum sp. 1612]|uniref:hypothetical protein n=1 Tax=Sulfurospirillum sp. 1612 TaxID=3094835 RepID=UPI002F936DF2
MKKTNVIKALILTIIFTSFVYANNTEPPQNEMLKYDKIFEKVSETRTGINQKAIDKIANPFIVEKVDPKLKKRAGKRRVYFRLDAIFTNKAKINGRWVALYHKIGTYKLIKIKRSSVLLKKSNKIREIFIRKHNGPKIIFSSK